MEPIIQTTVENTENLTDRKLKLEYSFKSLLDDVETENAKLKAELVVSNNTKKELQSSIDNLELQLTTVIEERDAITAVNKTKKLCSICNLETDNHIGNLMLCSLTCVDAFW